MQEYKNIIHNQEEIILTENVINELLLFSPDKLGSVKNHRLASFTKRVTQGFLYKQFLRYQPSRTKTISFDIFHDTYFFMYWTELSVIIPIRHLAKRLVTHNPACLYIIEVPSHHFEYVNYWKKNALEPLFLYNALERLGANVKIKFSNHKIYKNIYLSPSKNLKHKRLKNFFEHLKNKIIGPFNHKLKDIDTALCHRDIRIDKKILKELIPNHILVHSKDSYAKGASYEIMNGICTPPSFSLSLESIGDNLYILKNNMKPVLSALNAYFLEALEKRIMNTDIFIQKNNIKYFHCCDCLSEVVSVMAHRVNEAEGKVILWPHGFNAVHMNERKSKVDCANTLMRQVTDVWKANGITSYTMTDSLIDNMSVKNNVIDAQKKLKIVIMGTSHIVGRAPLFDITAHINTYKKILASLKKYAPSAVITFKPKANWESESWFKKYIDLNNDIEIETLPPRETEGYNTIFVLANLASSAMFDGIMRDIPIIIVREIEVEDYCATSEDDIVNINGFNMQIHALEKDPSLMTALVEKQKKWFLESTYDETDKFLQFQKNQYSPIMS